MNIRHLIEHPPNNMVSAEILCVSWEYEDLLYSSSKRHRNLLFMAKSNIKHWFHQGCRRTNKSWKNLDESNLFLLNHHLCPCWCPCYPLYFLTLFLCLPFRFPFLVIPVLTIIMPCFNHKGHWHVSQINDILQIDCNESIKHLLS